MISSAKLNEIHIREAKVTALKERMKRFKDLSDIGNAPFPKGWKLLKADIELEIKVNEVCRDMILDRELSENPANDGADARCYQRAVRVLKEVIAKVERAQPKIDRMNLAIGEHRAKIKLLQGAKQ